MTLVNDKIVSKEDAILKKKYYLVPTDDKTQLLLLRQIYTQNQPNEQL